MSPPAERWYISHDGTRCWYTGGLRGRLRPSGSTRRFASNRPWPGIIARNYVSRAGYVDSNVPFYATTRTVRHPRDHLHVMALSFELPSNLTIKHVTRYRHDRKRFVENGSVLLIRMVRSICRRLVIDKFERDHRTCISRKKNISCLVKFYVPLYITHKNTYHI